ncbi:uncharacterized protein ALTATR162_LOCUS6901 [Alternaria atra]|uniref:RNase III domain-containing protein n=1 Tax=Alternaria atra TaxID=119953 RepID=A0A8J2I470_9PLEO|nr:uncharacterized protein ALTATR162_LOCUS6901 [Alternaria atra]CAG5166264.1 unnamed protein product [Alternaria atra]
MQVAKPLQHLQHVLTSQGNLTIFMRNSLLNQHNSRLASRQSINTDQFYQLYQIYQTYQIYQPTLPPVIETKALEVEELINYNFSDKRITAEAVQMAAPKIAAIQHSTFDSTGLGSNKRLSVLGNAILAKAECFLKRNEPGTELRNGTLSNDALVRQGYQAGLDRCVIVADSKPAVRPKMVATTFEAVIGAVHHDNGHGAVQRVMKSLDSFDHPLRTGMSQTLHFSP